MKKKATEMMITRNVTFSEPDEGNISEIEILKEGEWKHPVYGEMKITSETISEMIQHFNDDLRKGLFITEGHPVGDEELPAVAWIKDLIKNNDALYAVVEWTKKGMELLKSKSYKFFSPEFYFEYEDPETREKYSNVLTGGALTNKPYFKSLEAIVLSEAILIHKKPKMELEKILMKEPEAITDEERVFMESMSEDLDEETRVKYSLAEKKVEDKKKKSMKDDKKDEEEDKKDNGADEDKEGEGEGSAEEEKGESKEEEDKEVKDKKEAKEKKKACEDTKKMSEVSMEAFQASEMRIQALEKENGELKMREREAKTEERLSKVVMSESNKFGTVLPKNRDDVKKFAMGLDEENEKKFFEIISSMPKSNIFQEIGGSQSTDDVPSKKTKHGEKISEESIQIDIEAKRIVTSEKKYDGSAISYEEALSMAEKNLKK